MANFLSRENPDNLSAGPMQVARRGTPPVQLSCVDSGYPVNMHLENLRFRRSVRRMKILTAISLTVTLMLVVKRYGPQILNHSTGTRSSEPNEVSPQPETVPSVLRGQNAPQSSTGELFKPENLLTASKEEAMSAIQEPVRDSDLARTSNRAKVGDIAAQYNMGLRFADGNGVAQNYAVAMTWFKKASEGGHPEAQLKLSLGYMKGIGVPYDEDQAVAWLKRAANGGNPWAQRAISHLYRTGQGVPRDYVRAYTWAKIASESTGNDDDQVRILGSGMSQIQIADAEHRVSIWKNSKQRPMNRPSERQGGPIP